MGKDKVAKANTNTHWSVTVDNRTLDGWAGSITEAAALAEHAEQALKPPTELPTAKPATSSTRATPKT
jgi:hypothetical protein